LCNLTKRSFNIADICKLYILATPKKNTDDYARTLCEKKAEN